MKKPLLLGSLFLWIGSSTVFPDLAASQVCNYFAGTAVAGQSINVDLCSIGRISPTEVNFTYFLGDLKVPSRANCRQGFWITLADGVERRPQSQATQQMLEVVCSYQREVPPVTSSAGAAIVFDPPSNVRSSANGEILCSVRERMTINIYGSTSGWYYTDVCGPMGVIHRSQIRFFW